MNLRSLFLQHVAQTSEAPMGFEISRAEGCYLYDAQQRAYIDLIGGISVCNIGHGHPSVKEAIHAQTERYLHVMVYGEVIQSPQVEYATTLTAHLPEALQSVYFTNSGSEATEGAMKLAKRYTGRANMISFRNSYHGSTQGALSVMGSTYWQQAFRPLLPGIQQFEYGSDEALAAIDHTTACVLVEPVQSEAGVRVPSINWMQALRQRCTETGTLLIFDEIQTAFGRTGTLFRFEALGIVPDILLLGKALGGGLPLGAFISSPSVMQSLSVNPVLGHITTFGGHPLCCAAGLAAFRVLLDEQLTHHVGEKEAIFQDELHELGLPLNACGMLMALHFDSFETNKKVIDACLAVKENEPGLFTDWFLFAPQALRLAPPLSISEAEIRQACAILRQRVQQVLNT